MEKVVESLNFTAKFFKDYLKTSGRNPSVFIGINFDYLPIIEDFAQLRNFIFDIKIEDSDLIGKVGRRSFIRLSYSEVVRQLEESTVLVKTTWK